MREIKEAAAVQTKETDLRRPPPPPPAGGPRGAVGAAGVGEVESVSQQSEGSSSSPGSPLQPGGPEPLGQPGKSSSSSSLDKFKLIDGDGLMMTTEAQFWCMVGNVGSYHVMKLKPESVSVSMSKACSSPSSPCSPPAAAMCPG